MSDISKHNPYLPPRQKNDLTLDKKIVAPPFFLLLLCTLFSLVMTIPLAALGMFGLGRLSAGLQQTMTPWLNVVSLVMLSCLLHFLVLRGLLLGIIKSENHQRPMFRTNGTALITTVTTMICGSVGFYTAFVGGPGLFGLCLPFFIPPIVCCLLLREQIRRVNFVTETETHSKFIS